MRTVTFTDEAPDLDGFEVLTIEGDSVESKEELLDAIAEGFGFPDWFGRNWDALEECLRDLDAVNDGYALVITDATAIWARASTDLGHARRGLARRRRGRRRPRGRAPPRLRVVSRLRSPGDRADRAHEQLARLLQLARLAALDALEREALQARR